MLPDIITGAVLAVITLGGVANHIRLSALYHEEQKRADEATSKALQAESDRRYAAAQFEFLQASIVQMLQRPVMATMTDVQVQHMIDTLAAYARTAKDPAKMN